MTLELGNKFLDCGDIRELFIRKSVGDHSRLYAAVEYAEVDIVGNLSDLMGQLITCRFEDGQVQVDLFTGVITAVELVGAETIGVLQTVQIVAHSESVRMDLVPRTRVFQDPNGTAGDIVDKILESGLARGERRRGNFFTPVPLSVQFEETDFQYLKRLLNPLGIPVIVADTIGVFYLGNHDGTSHSIAEAEIAGDIYRGSLAPLLAGESYAAADGRIGQLQGAVSDFADSLEDRSQYFATSIHPDSKERQRSALSANDMADFSTKTACLKLRTKRVFMAVGDKVQIENEDSYSVMDAVFRFSYGRDRKLELLQQYKLVGIQELSPKCEEIEYNPENWLDGLEEINADIGGSFHMPIEARIRKRGHQDIPWRSRIFVAKVTKNEGDPEALGRIQVRFDWENDEPEKAKQCWVDVMTPFAGASDKTYGFLMLPEVGEQVLVRFIEPGDDKPVIIGSLRRKTVVDSLDTAQHKVIRTPSGNCIDLISKEDKDTIRLRAGNVEGFHLTVETSGGKTNITMECNDAMLLKGRDVKIQGRTVDIHSEKSMKLTAGEDLSLQSSGESEINAQTISAKSSTNMVLYAGTDLSVNSKAGTKITSTAAIQLKGTIIDLN